MSNLWNSPQFGILGFLAVALAIAVMNLYTLRELSSYASPDHFPRVSILVPARDEEINIGPCISSLLAQDYPDFEVVVLDDHSRDRTGEILARLAAGNSRLRVLQGRPLPAGWMGKHWAGHQLAEAADGELLLFTDADTQHSPQALNRAVGALQHEGADLLSVLPQEIVVTWAEKLVVPVMMWGIMAFMPLALAYRVRWPALVTAIGQFMLFRRDAYAAIGGFAAVRQEILDDVALARLIKARGLRWRLASGRAEVRCRMYRGASEVFAGFSKNFYATIGGNIPVFLLIWTWLLGAFLGPLMVLGAHLAGLPVTSTSGGLAVLAIIFSLLLWTISHRRFGFPGYLVPLYPVTIILAYMIALRSVWLRFTSRATWKGRTVANSET